MREHSFHSQNKPGGEFFFFSKDGTFFKVKTNRFPLGLLKQTRPNLIILSAGATPDAFRVPFDIFHAFKDENKRLGQKSIERTTRCLRRLCYPLLFCEHKRPHLNVFTGFFPVLATLSLL